MNAFTKFAAVAALSFAAIAPAMAQTVGYGRVYVAPDHSVSSRSLIGVPVYNDAHEKIGTIETVMVQPGGGDPLVVLSVGDFVGHGPKTVAVPMTHLAVADGGITMAGATKASLESMPVYGFAGG